jgi:hypothetical protein
MQLASLRLEADRRRQVGGADEQAEAAGKYGGSLEQGFKHGITKKNERTAVAIHERAHVRNGCVWFEKMFEMNGLPQSCRFFVKRFYARSFLGLSTAEVIPWP